MIQDGRLARAVAERYAGWEGDFGRGLLAPERSLSEIAALTLQRNADVAPVSGRQEALENLVNAYVG